MNDMLVEIQFDYTSDLEENVLTIEQLKLLESVCSKPVRHEQLSKRHIDRSTSSLWSDEDKEHPDSKVLLDKYDVSVGTNIVPLNRLLALDLPIKFKITHRIKETPEYNVQENILHKLLSLDEKLKNFDQAAQFNTKVGVHISDLGLLNVREVTWLNDACTEELQRMLDEGWRILAVCPQPDSRRPDYVLGRNEKGSE